MKYLKLFFLTAALPLAIFTGGCQHSPEKMTDDEIFKLEFDAVCNQQSSIRKENLLQSLRRESAKAVTLSSISELELMLENYELSAAEKNTALLNYFDRALLYMQILLFPEKREVYLSSYINKNLLYELSSIFLNITIAENFLARCPETESTLRNRWQEIINNKKIEYAALNINILDSADKMPSIKYPLSDDFPFENTENFRLLKSAGCPVFDIAQQLYNELSRKYEENLPLVLITLLYRSPDIINQTYKNDPLLKSDFAELMTELVHIWQDRQLFANAQNAFTLRSDICKSLKNLSTPAPEMLNAAARSDLAYQTAYLKMLCSFDMHPFFAMPISAAKSNQLSPVRLKTLRFLFNDILNSIRR